MKIERIELFPAYYPISGYFRFFSTHRGQTGRPTIILKCVADDGTVGWGESLPMATWSDETFETAIVALRQHLIPALVGHDPQDIEGAHQLLDRAIAPGFSTAMPVTRSGLDLALHDLAGRASGEPLHAMWGQPKGGPLTLSWTVDVRTLDEVEQAVAAGRQRGYAHFNLKIGPDADFDERLARQVRQLAPDAFIWADANGGYDQASALRAARLLAEAGIDALEAPIRPNRISGYQALKRLGALPIYMDEGVVSHVELAEFIRLDMLDGLTLKPARCGGLGPCRKQIELLHKHGLPMLGSGLTDGDIALAGSVALYAAYGMSRPAALNGPQLLAESVLGERLDDTDGQIVVPSKTGGLGITVDEQRVRELSRQTFDPDIVGE